MPTSRIVKTVMAVVFMLLFIVSLGGRFWAATQSTHITGPGHIAVSNKAVFITYNSEVLELSHSGALLHRFSLEKAGLAVPPMDMRMLADGRLLIAEQHPAQLYACRTDKWSCTALPARLTVTLRNQYKVIQDPAKASFLAVDFAGGRLWRIPVNGGNPIALTKPGLLSGSNDLARDSNGDLWIADSHHERLALLTADSHDQWRIIKSFDTSLAPATTGKAWVTMLSLDAGGDLWAIQSSPTLLGSSDLIVYRPQQGALLKVDLADDAYLTDIAAMNNTILASDSQRFALYRIDTISHTVNPFGDESLHKALREGISRKQEYNSWSNRAMAATLAFGALMILTAIWATPRGKRWTPTETATLLVASTAAIPKTEGIHWLKRNPKIEKWLRWATPMLWLTAVLPIILLGGMYFTLITGMDGKAPKIDQGKLDEIKHIFIFILIMLVGLPLFSRAGLRSILAQLGTDGQRLYVKYPTQSQSSFLPDKLVYSDSQISYQDQIFSLKTGKGQAIYAADEINHYIAPLLHGAKKLSPWEMLKYKFSHREPNLIGGFAYIIIIVIAGVITGAWRILFPHISSFLGS